MAYRVRVRIRFSNTIPAPVGDRATAGSDRRMLASSRDQPSCRSLVVFVCTARHNFQSVIRQRPLENLGSAHQARARSRVVQSICDFSAAFGLEIAKRLSHRSLNSAIDAALEFDVS